MVWSIMVNCNQLVVLTLYLKINQIKYEPEKQLIEDLCALSTKHNFLFFDYFTSRTREFLYDSKLKLKFKNLCL